MINTFFKTLAVVVVAGFIGKCAGDKWDAPANQKDPGAPLVAGIPIDGKAFFAPCVPEDGNIELGCFHISFQNVEGYEVVNLRFDGILNPILDVNSDDDMFNDEYMRFYGTESPCQNIYLTIDGKPKGFSVYNFRDGYGPFFAKGCNCDGVHFVPFFGKGVLDGSCQVCKNSFVLSFVNVPELRDGKPHTVKITVKAKDLLYFPIWGEQIYEDVIFEAGDVCPEIEEDIDDEDDEFEDDDNPNNIDPAEGDDDFDY